MNTILNVFDPFKSPISLTNFICLVFFIIVLVRLIIDTFSNSHKYKTVLKEKGFIKSIFKFRDFTSFLGTYILILFFSCVLYLISTIFVEYPLTGTVYTKENGEWTAHKGRVFHKPFDFDGYTVYPRDLTTREKTLNNIFKLKYRIDTKRLYTVFDAIKQERTKRPDDGFKYVVDSFVEKQFKTLEYFTSKQDLLDEHLRLVTFRTYLEPYGFIVESVTIN